ncbi:thioester domain-containing protein [Streptomyces bambusae]|uniref:TQXA domain-containing protein n=1 Tax=Streptomyces bambusae TaxID=1550616 RepID=A0ABS6ZBB5_9ACTN|nr:thioester domain-containing protein [Streptomyces bambusae]MBW5485050.1 TQXA domain-containing protein [Streptomyces bambusae]
MPELAGAVGGGGTGSGGTGGSGTGGGGTGGGGARAAARRPFAVALLAAALAAAPGSPAAAAEGDGAARRAPEGATAVLDGLKTYGQAVLRTKDGAVRHIPAGLYEMRVDGGGMLQTYGVGVAGFAQPQARYTETAWSGSPLGGNGEAGRIRWVLEHSYPQLNDLAGLAKAAGTQVAIWRLADGAQVEAADPAAEKLADYLQKEAGRMAEPPASLSLDPAQVTGPVGSRLGPVTVRTGAQSVTVTPDAAAQAMGVRVVDAQGQPVTAAGHGSRLWFEVPAGTPDGVASVTVQGSTRVPVGRVFTSGEWTQAQIVAGSSESAASATAAAVWPQALAVQSQAQGHGQGGHAAQGGAGVPAVPPAAAGGTGTTSPDAADDRLAASGSSAATPVIAALAVGLVVLGGMVVLLVRKRPLDGEDDPTG